MTSRFSFSRSGTESSTGTSASGSSAWSRPSIRGRAATWRDKEKKKKEVPLVEDFYSTYELDWDALRAWLAARFPELEFGEQYDSSGDYYRFRIPRKLTEEEKGDVWFLRNDQQRPDAIPPPGTTAVSGDAAFVGGSAFGDDGAR